MGPTHSQQQSICMGGGLNTGGNIHPSTKTIDAAKHMWMGPTRLQQQSICMRGGKSDTSGEATTQATRPSTRQKHSRMGPTRSQQQSICMRGGLCNDYGYNKHRLDIPNRGGHEAQLGAAQRPRQPRGRSNGGRRFFSNAFKKEVTVTSQNRPSGPNLRNGPMYCSLGAGGRL
jgi:hypothetical protein